MNLAVPKVRDPGNCVVQQGALCLGHTRSLVDEKLTAKALGISEQRDSREAGRIVEKLQPWMLQQVNELVADLEGSILQHFSSISSSSSSSSGGAAMPSARQCAKQLWLDNMKPVLLQLDCTAQLLKSAAPVHAAEPAGTAAVAAQPTDAAAVAGGAAAAGAELVGGTV
jgi:hypothetical protein